MKKDTDGRGRNRLVVSRRRLADALEVTQNRYADWQTQGLLDEEDPAEAHDAVELAVLDRLIGKAGPKRAKKAWRVIRPRFREGSPGTYKKSWAVVDQTLERHALALTPTELAKSVGIESPVYVIPLGPVSREAERIFKEHASESSE